MHSTDSKFNASLGTIDDRLYFNDLDLEHIEIMNEYQKLLKSNKYTEAAQLLNKSDSKTFFIGAWLMNLFQNQTNAVGQYIQAKDSVNDPINTTTQPSITIDDQGSLLVNSGLVDDDGIPIKFKYSKLDLEQNKNPVLSSGSWKLNWDETFYSNEHGKYVIDPYGDMAYLDGDDYYYLTKNGEKCWKDKSYTPWRFWYYFPKTKNKYYFDNDGNKVLYSQEANHVLDLAYFAEEYYDTGEKTYMFYNQTFFLQDGDPYDVAPSTNLKSYFYYLIDDDGRMYNTENYKKYYIKHTGLIYYVSSDNLEWALEDNVYHRIEEDKDGVITYKNDYRDSLYGETYHMDEQGNKYITDEDGRDYWRDAQGVKYYYTKDHSAIYYESSDGNHWSKNEDNEYYRTDEESGETIYRQWLDGMDYYKEPHMNHKYTIDEDGDWISYGISGIAPTTHYVSKEDGRIYIKVESVIWYYDETIMKYINSETGEESDNPLD